MKTNLYKFYKNKYELETLDIKISDKKIMFLIYDEKYNYYISNDTLFEDDESVDILKKIKYFNKKYRLNIINFYPVCYCKKTLVIAFRTECINSYLDKYSKDNMPFKYRDLLGYHKNYSLVLFISSKVKEEIYMSRKYINRYRFHGTFFKKYILTEKRRRKKEFRELLYSLLPDGKSLIDVSCGDNSDMLLMAQEKKYQTIVGNDICLDYLYLNDCDNVIYTNDDIELNSVKSKCYDVSFCKNTLHHMGNLININNLLEFLDRISDCIIVVEIMDPKEYKGLPRLLNKYLYSKFLKDVGNCYLNEEEFVNIINKKFSDRNIEYITFESILGVYKIAKITNRKGE